MRRMALAHGALAAAATLASSLALRGLVSGGGWIVSLFIVLLLVYAVGSGLRWARSPLPLTVLAQALVAAGTIGYLFAGQTFHWLLPTQETLGVLGRDLGHALRLMRLYRAPLTGTPSLNLLVTCTMALTGITVDAIATRRRLPVLAGLPLLWPLVTVAVARPHRIDVFPFLLTALPWVVLLGIDGVRRARAWSSLSASPLTPTLHVEDHRGVGRYAAVARTVGLVAVLVAAVVPSYLPLAHLSIVPRDPAPAAGTGPGGRQGDRVRFIDTLDLTQDLGDRSNRVVLRYRTNDAQIPPLKVMAASKYTGGEWLSPRPDLAGASFDAARRPPAPPGLAPDAASSPYTITVEENKVQAPYLPVPSFATTLTGTTVRHRYDPAATTLLVESTPGGYSASYVRPRPGATATSSATEESPGVTPDDLAFEGPFTTAVQAEVRRAVGGAQTPLQKAEAFQTYLRQPGRFTYSLTLSASPTAPDPLSSFIETRRGYCVQFATLMVMMARSEGIPARIAYGFLPGATGPDGRRVVTPADAHAWPELYLQGLGWLRFEATPPARSGEAPVYTSGTRPSTPPQPAEPTTSRPTASATPAPPPPVPGAGSGRDGQTDWTPAWWALGLLLLIAALAVLPWRARARRAALRAPGYEGSFEDAWRWLLGRLADLGVPAPAARAPRAMRHELSRALPSGSETERDLGRVVAVLEAERYRRPEDQVPAAAWPWEEMDRLVTAAASRAAWWLRAAAFLFPRDARGRHPAPSRVSGPEGRRQSR